MMMPRPAACIRAAAAEASVACGMLEWRQRPTAAARGELGKSSGGGEGGGDAGRAEVHGSGLALGWARFAIWAAPVVGEATADWRRWACVSGAHGASAAWVRICKNRDNNLSSQMLRTMATIHAIFTKHQPVKLD